MLYIVKANCVDFSFEITLNSMSGMVLPFPATKGGRGSLSLLEF
jgi:hypothetical protein